MSFVVVFPGLLSRITNRGSSERDRSGDRDDHDYKTSMGSMGRKFGNRSHISKTDSSNSLTSHKNGDAGNGTGKAANCNGNGKNRSSVVFEEPLKTTTMSNSSTSTAPPHPSASKVATATNRTVNGILRKGSDPGDDIVGPPDKNDKDTLAKLLEANDRKSAAMTAGNKKSSGGKNSHSGFKKKSERDGGGSHKLESVTESGLEDGDSTTTTKDTVAGGKTADRNSRSRSSSSKTSSSKADKAAKDLALTRDLPWCGCWGNGCL